MCSGKVGHLDEKSDTKLPLVTITYESVAFQEYIPVPKKITTLR